MSLGQLLIIKITGSISCLFLRLGSHCVAMLAVSGMCKVGWSWRFTCLCLPSESKGLYHHALGDWTSDEVPPEWKCAPLSQRIRGQMISKTRAGFCPQSCWSTDTTHKTGVALNFDREPVSRTIYKFPSLGTCMPNAIHEQDLHSVR